MRFARATPPIAQRLVVPPATGLFYAALPAARRAIESNLEQVLGPTSAFERHRRAYLLLIYYAQSVTYLYALHSGAPLPVDVTFVNRERIDACLAEGNGAITTTGHFGAWQLMPYLLRDRQDARHVTMAMAEEPNRHVSDFEREVRSQFDIVYTTASPFALLDLHKVLRRGELVGMQLDRQIGAGHMALPFFGKPASFPIGATLLARLARCPIVPVFAVYPDGDRSRVEVHYEEPIRVAHTRDRYADLREALERTVAVYEKWVRRYPLQWFNFYDFWAPPTEPSSM